MSVGFLCRTVECNRRANPEKQRTLRSWPELTTHPPPAPRLRPTPSLAPMKFYLPWDLFKLCGDLLYTIWKAINNYIKQSLYNKHWLWSMKTSNASCNCNHPSIACATEHWTPTHFQDVSCLRGWVLVHRLHAKHNACTPQGVSLFSRTMFNVNTQLSETLWY